jgi:hypothetical protein
MPKEAAAGSSQGGLIYLKYTFKYRSQFDEPNDDSLDASNELLGAYSRDEDDAMTVAFGGRGKKRLNRVLMSLVSYTQITAILHESKERKEELLLYYVEAKKTKVLTNRPKRTETAEEPRPAEGSSVVQPSHPAPVEAKTELAEEPKPKIAVEQLKALSPLQEQRTTKGTKDCFSNSEEKKDGQRTRRCYRIYEGVNSCLSTCCRGRGPKEI